MEFSANYKKRQPPRRGGKRKTNLKKPILIAVAVLAVVALLVGGVFLFRHFKTESASGGGFEKVSESVSETAPPTTEAPTETPTETIGDVSITPCEMTMYSTVTTLNVRSIPSADGSKLGMVGQETPLSVTGRCSNGWYRISYNGGVGYVSGEYVAEAEGQTKRSDAPYLFKVNRTQNIVIAYSKDANGDYTVPAKAMVCSVGMDGKTPTGTFVTPGTKYEWRLLSGNVYGQYATRINGPYLFHSVPYFTKDKGDLEYAEYNKLGSPASLGCIRLSVEDAKWVYENCPEGTTVVIYDSGEKEPLAKPTPIKIDENDTARRGWDPTDPDANNPWKK